MLNFLIYILKRIVYNYYINILVKARFSIQTDRIAPRIITFFEKNYTFKIFIRSF